MRCVLITGSSSGIGRATALRLQRSGFHVFAGVRRQEDADALTQAAGPDLVPIHLDVTDQDSVESAIDQVRGHLGSGGLDGLVNNAGAPYPGPLETLDISEIRDQLEVNLLGQIRVTQAALPLLRATHGRIIFVGSIGGKVAFQFGGPYHASKYAIEGVADAWRQELLPDGVAVTVIEPGVMSTPIWDKAVERVDAQLADNSPALDRYRERLTNFRERLTQGNDGDDPAKVAAVVEQVLTTARVSAHYPVGLPARAVSALRPIVPEKLWDRVASRVVG